MENKNVIESIIKINTAGGSGSGFYVKQHNIIVTNYHVIAGERAVAVITQDNKRYIGNVILIVPKFDIALIQTEEELDLPEVFFKEVDSLQAMEKISVLGFPFGLPFTITEGIVSSAKQNINGTNYIQSDAAINPGNSGGAMINAAGEIIGLTTSKFNQAENIGFALPIDHVISELDSIDKIDRQQHTIKCPSCNVALEDQEEYCGNCGVEIATETLYFKAEPNELTKFVEQAISEMGVSPVTARCGTNIWEMHHGSSLLRIFTYIDTYLYVTCPIVKLPQENLAEIYRYILEENTKPYQLGISNNLVYLSYRVHLADVYSSFGREIQQQITMFAQLADDMDNFMIQKFGCEWPEEALVV